MINVMPKLNNLAYNKSDLRSSHASFIVLSLYTLLARFYADSELEIPNNLEPFFGDA